MAETQHSQNSNISFQKNIAIVGVLLFLGKLVAWLLTKSDAVFSDAMESIVNIVAAFMGLYSLYIAAKPKDLDHPYGHGKVEFVTSAVEGVLIIVAAVIILIQAVNSFLDGNIPKKLDWGIAIFAVTGLINYYLGYLSYKKGLKENSAVLQSSGKHLQSDTYTTFAVVLSLILVYFTKIYWIDSLVALLFALYIIFFGYKILRKSLSGIMDEADPVLLQEISTFLNDHRKNTWIDVHNMKIQQHGSHLHIDAHVTLPWYFSLREAHDEMEELIKLIAKNGQRKIEFNFHMDDCKEFSCKICQMENCPVRLHPFEKRVVWDEKNISQIQKHSVEN